MQTKLLYTGGVVVVVIIVTLAAVLLFVTSVQQQQESAEKSPVLISEPFVAPEVRAVLDKKISLVAELLTDPVLIEEVRRSNQAHESISLEEILKLDARWRSTEGVDEFIESFLVNDVARKLIEFQETNPGFSEIFVVDAHGLNVGQTNKTTDYYQADEAWWIEAYNAGKGKVAYGDIEYDESAQTEAISLYIPIFDPENQQAIGVTKAVVSLAAIKMDL